MDTSEIPLKLQFCNQTTWQLRLCGGVVFSWKCPFVQPNIRNRKERYRPFGLQLRYRTRLAVLLTHIRLHKIVVRDSGLLGNANGEAYLSPSFATTAIFDALASPLRLARCRGSRCDLRRDLRHWARLIRSTLQHKTSEYHFRRCSLKDAVGRAGDVFPLVRYPRWSIQSALEFEQSLVALRFVD